MRPLILQRASAGSGKTFALTREFLKMLLSVSYQDGPRRLRTDAELEDALRHILAITFTNKATAEMKQRIVAALDALAYDPMNPDTPYIAEFAKEFHASPEKISAAARKALTILLNEYSDFQVSTIDSFFQTVLRTFAYESHLNDTYGLEIDADYINSMALDAVMEAIDNRMSSNETGDWIVELMNREKNSRKRNFFRPGGYSLREDVKQALGCLEKEDFKVWRDELDEYWSKGNVRKHFEAAEKYYSQKSQAMQQRVISLAAECLACLDPLSEFCNQTKLKGLRKFAEGIWPDKRPDTEAPLVKATARKAAANRPSVPQFDIIDMKYREVVQALSDMMSEPAFCLWPLYAELFPMLGMVQSTRDFIKAQLEESNLIQLSETNSLLSRIISDSDTPFVYEKLGTRLNHLLIDEFQDTSALQWKNLKPLVANSISEGHESLLIGDAKQSIYRFRNADPSIILDKIQADSDLAWQGIQLKGETAEENTNWRSDQNIVEFNNFIFSTVSGMVADKMKGDTPVAAPTMIERLYANPVQRVARENGLGYVCMRVTEKDRQEERPNDRPSYFRDLGLLVDSLRKRGYRQKDIAFLTIRNSTGIKVVESLIEFNNSLPPGALPIDFISDTSLRLSSSRAIRIIISCLENIASGAAISQEEAPDSGDKEPVDWYAVRADLHFFVATHPDMPPHIQIREFLKNGNAGNSLFNRIPKMESVALPALIEVIAATLVDDELRSSDAPFIAALQDAVLDFCASHPSDISSFMEWWEAKGKNISITSPEGSDAVQIMTIHKSKGLEFGCVIIPEAIWGLSPAPTQREWKWVEPVMEPHPDFKLPPVLPIILSQKNLDNTPHKADYKEYIEKFVMDNLNSAYVALTRAVHELYIYPVESKQASIQNMMIKACREWGMMKEEDEGKVLTFGQPLSREQIQKIITKEEENKRKKEGDLRTSLSIHGYNVNPEPDFLEYEEDREAEE